MGGEEDGRRGVYPRVEVNPAPIVLKNTNDRTQIRLATQPVRGQQKELPCLFTIYSTGRSRMGRAMCTWI